VNCAPVIPGITDSPRDLEALVRAAAEAGAQHVFANPLFLKPCSAAVFLPFLEQEFPQLAESYHQRFKNRAFLSKSYHRRISQVVGRLRVKYGIHRERRNQPAAAPPLKQQLQLF
jgi:DNA repair photolyase